MESRSPQAWLQSNEGQSFSQRFKREFNSLLGDTNYEKLNKMGYMDDFIKIAAVLNHKDVVVEQLAKMDKALKTQLALKGKLDKSGDIIKKPGKSYVGNYKVVEEFFNQWAHDNGFNQSQSVDCLDTQGNPVKVDLPAESPTAAGQLSVFGFQFMLKSGYLFRDKGAMERHGEFSHMLAVYILAEADKQYGFLTHPVSELYKMLGEEVCEAYAFKAFHATLWDPIFDAFGEEDEMLLNSPLALNIMVSGKQFGESAKPNILTEDQQEEFSLLRQIVRGRIDKRIEERKDGQYQIYQDLADQKNGICVNNVLFRSEGGRSNYILEDSPDFEKKQWLASHDNNNANRDESTDDYDDGGYDTIPDTFTDSEDEKQMSSRSRVSGGGMFGGARVEQETPDDNELDMDNDNNNVNKSNR